MTPVKPPAASAVFEIARQVRGYPVFIAGSAVAAEHYGLPEAYDDVDVFCPTEPTLIAVAQRLLDNGCRLTERFVRVWQRWQKLGFNGWHTNSVKLASPLGFEVNLVHKKNHKQPTTTLAQVLESFDFGLLGIGYDMENCVFRDMRSYLFPHLQADGPYPLMPTKRNDWRDGFISQYNGLREAGRYARYIQYGYDLSLVKDDLLTGYTQVIKYLNDRGDKDKLLLAEIYGAIADRIQGDEIEELVEASKQIIVLDSLDEIMEALE